MYDKGTPILTDDQYDALFGDSSSVGSESGDTPHAFPMYSLQKHYAEDGEAPLVGEELEETPKLDGCAVSLKYVAGHLTLGLTRGNGKLGKIITDKLARLVPTKLTYEMECFHTVQIRGEVVSLASIENSRNYTAGLLNTKDTAEFDAKVAAGKTVFVAYGVQAGEQDGITATYWQDMNLLESNSFLTVSHFDWDSYPTDGVVYRVKSNKRFNELGYTSKHPRGAYAFKTKQKPVVTELLDVIWQTGKSGKVTPVAILEPVEIGEAIIQRATLNNMAYIQALGLEIGCKVEVIRAGEIIPCIVGRAD